MAVRVTVVTVSWEGGGEEEKERAVTLLPRVGERKKNGKEKERKV